MCQVEFTMSRCMAPATNLHIEVWLKPVPNMIQIESLLLKTIHFLVFPRAPINTTVCKNEARQPCRGWLYPNSNCCQNICRIALDLRLTSHGFLWVFPKFPSHCQEYEKLLEQGPSLWQRLGLGDLATWGERASSHRDLMAFKGLRGRTGNQQPPIGMVQRVLLGLQLDEVPQNRLPMSFFGMFLAQFLQVSCANFIPADGGIIGFNLLKW